MKSLIECLGEAAWAAFFIKGLLGKAIALDGEGGDRFFVNIAREVVPVASLY